MCFKTCTTRAGNGDILTHYEAAERMRTGVSGVMVGRGALIKPWIFGEHRDGASWEPSANERVKSRTPDLYIYIYVYPMSALSLARPI